MRRAFTLIELVVAISIASVLTLAMGSVLVVASRAMPSGSDRMLRSAEAARALDVLADELLLAVSIGRIEYSGMQFTVPDRNGDNAPELVTVRVASGTLGMVRSDADGSAVLATDVSAFIITAATRDRRVTRIDLALTLNGSFKQTLRRSVPLPNRPEAP